MFQNFRMYEGTFVTSLFIITNKIKSSPGGNILSDNLLNIKNVSKEYYGNKVLKNINIEVKKG